MKTFQQLLPLVERQAREGLFESSWPTLLNPLS
jgi:hypothetical protein